MILDLINKYQFHARTTKPNETLYHMGEGMARRHSYEFLGEPQELINITYGGLKKDCKYYTPPIKLHFLREFGTLEQVDSYDVEDTWRKNVQNFKVYKLTSPELGITFISETYSNTVDDRCTGRGAGTYWFWLMTKDQARKLKHLSFPCLDKNPLKEKSK